MPSFSNYSTLTSQQTTTKNATFSTRGSTTAPFITATEETQPLPKATSTYDVESIQFSFDRLVSKEAEATTVRSTSHSNRPTVVVAKNSDSKPWSAAIDPDEVLAVVPHGQVQLIEEGGQAIPVVDVIATPNTKPSRPKLVLNKPKNEQIGLDSDKNSLNISTLSAVAEKNMKGLGKIIGMGVSKDKRLLVPSFTTGKITALSLTNLATQAEYTCNGCTVYDVAVMSNGDMILSLGKQKKLKRLSSSGTVLSEVPLQFSTKGISVNEYNEIFVLGWSDNTVHVFDETLKYIGPIKVPIGAPQDCNFLTINSSDVIFVSCELEVFQMDLQGHKIGSIIPPVGGYSVGIAFDPTGRSLVVRRGTPIVDVYDSRGRFMRSVGETANAIWSDIAIADGNFYVTDYLTSNVKMFRYQ